MQRDVAALDRRFDVLVIGGGIYGACVARLAARSGLSVALVERGDFSGAVSHNSLKIVHGGFRYIQHFDLPRIWESVTAQRAWLSAAPHLVRPMRCVIPAYGLGTRGPMALAAGICAFHAVTLNRNSGLPSASRLPWSGVLSTRALLAKYPDLARRDLTGGAYWYDAQMLDADRLLWECLQDACDHGARIVNHAEAVHLLIANSKVEGAAVRDTLTERQFDVRAQVTVNATGPFVESLLRAGPKPLRAPQNLVLTRNVNIVTRQLFPTYDAVGVGSNRASDAAIGKSKRLFFVTPWQDCSVVGTSHTKHEGTPDDIQNDVRHDVDTFLGEINESLPRFQLSKRDVLYVHSGLTPAGDEVERAKRSTVIDHARTDGVRSLITVLGIKYTTAPTVAANVVSMVRALLNSQGNSAAGSEFSSPLPGAVGYEPQANEWQAEVATWPTDADWARRIYGANAAALLDMLPAAGLSAADHVFRCRVLYGIDNEMVVRLRDAVLRATDLAQRGRLAAGQLAWCADIMQSKFGWSAQRRQAEMGEVLQRVRLRDEAATIGATT